MIDKKFTIAKTGAGVKLKDFKPPVPGLTTKPSVIIGKAVVQALQKTFIVTGTEEEDQTAIASRQFNTPVYSDITFEGSSYTDENNNTITFQTVNIQLVLLTVMNQKNIIRTSLQGRNGDVLEYISDGNYQIKVEGKIFGNGANNYPQEAVQALIAICKAPQSITVTSDFLKMFDISSIAVLSYNIDQVEATRNYQEFTINCLSDKELILLKNA